LIASAVAAAPQLVFCHYNNLFFTVFARNILSSFPASIIHHSLLCVTYYLNFCSFCSNFLPSVTLALSMMMVTCILPDDGLLPVFLTSTTWYGRWC